MLLVPSSGLVEIGWSYQLSKPTRWPRRVWPHGAEDADTGGLGAAAPVVEELRRRGLGALLPEQSQFVFEVVRLRQRFVQLQGFRQS